MISLYAQFHIFLITDVQISPNLYELRFFFGKGYRIYYTIKNDIVVILLQAGDKSDQQKDIAIAKVT